MAHVLLLRAPTRNSPDRYETAFEEKGLKPVSTSVIETGYTNLEKLREVIVAGPERGDYRGVIITSARSCEAWRAVVLQLVQEYPEQEEGQAAGWASIPFYVVGEATRAALFGIREVVGDYPYAPAESNILGSASGTSEKLAHLIVDDLRDTPNASRRLLYLTGDKNRETLPNVLREGGLTPDALQVYETHGSSTFRVDLEKVLEETAAGGAASHIVQKAPHPTSSQTEPANWWIVFFAPSEAEFATPVLREHFTLLPRDSCITQAGKKRVARIAAIGPTTGHFLRNNLVLNVDVVSLKPNPASLAEAITDFDAANSW